MRSNSSTISFTNTKKVDNNHPEGRMDKNMHRASLQNMVSITHSILFSFPLAFDQKKNWTVRQVSCFVAMAGQWPWSPFCLTLVADNRGWLDSDCMRVYVNDGLWSALNHAKTIAVKTLKPHQRENSRTTPTPPPPPPSSRSWSCLTSCERPTRLRIDRDISKFEIDPPFLFYWFFKSAERTKEFCR